MHIDEFLHRFHNAKLAALGAAGICMLNCYRVSQELGYLSQSTKILLQSGLFGLASGVVWFFMPRSYTDSREDTTTQTKTVLRDPLKVLIRRALTEHKNSMEDIRRSNNPSTANSYSSGTRSYSYPASSSYSTPSSTTTTVSSNQVSVVTVEKKFFDPWEKEFSKTPIPIIDEYEDDIPEDSDTYLDQHMIDEALAEEELEDYYASLEEDPFEEHVDDDEDY